MKNILFIIFLLFLLSLSSCKEESIPPPQESVLNLKLEDVSCTEAWITLTTTNLQLPSSLNLLKNDNIIKTINMETSDTLLYIDSLLPNQTYNFQISGIGNPASGIKSNVAPVTTLDTTSHNFTWQTFEFGQNIGSALYDAAIIDENNIWAVGEIYMNDSLGNPDPSAYNAVHWDGNGWNLYKIQFYTFCGQTHTGSYPIRSIFAFNNTEIFISSGSQITEINGITQGEIQCIPVSVNKLWGIDRNNLYAVGANGLIQHFDGGGWRSVETGTNISLNDIYGTPNGKEIWTCGWNSQTGQSMILKITNNTSEIIWDSEIPEPNFVYSGLINSICANGNNEFVFVGGQVYRQSLLAECLARREWVKTSNGSQVLVLGNYGYRIKGSNKNNISVAGDAAMIWHFNGSTWHKFSELHNEEDRLYGLAVSENLIIAVGKRYAPNTLGVGLIIVGRRTN